MRSNQNPSGSITRSVGDRNIGDGQPSMVAKLSLPQVPVISPMPVIAPMPVEWLDAGSWRLPSGKALAEFALQAGFLAPLLFRADGFRKSGKSGGKLTDKSEMSGAPHGASQMTGDVAASRGPRGKQFGKGDGR